jgi:hypothetical protein
LSAVAVEITCNVDTFKLSLSGKDRILAMRGRIEIPMSAVLSASVQAKTPLINELAVRVRGSSIPTRVLSGSYTVWPHARIEKGDRHFWVTYAASEVLVVDTSLARPRRIVVQTERRRELAVEIGELAATARSAK